MWLARSLWLVRPWRFMGPEAEDDPRCVLAIGVDRRSGG